MREEGEKLKSMGFGRCLCLGVAFSFERNPNVLVEPTHCASITNSIFVYVFHLKNNNTKLEIILLIDRAHFMFGTGQSVVHL